MSLLSAADTTARRLWRESQGHVYGIDVSKWQKPDDGDASTKDDLSWAQMPLAHFVIFKVSQADFRDPKFFAHYDTLRAVRPEVKTAGYHFLTETHSPRIQAETFAIHTTARPLDMRPNCDLEKVASSKPRWPTPVMAGRYALEWMRRIADLTGFGPAVLYSSKRHLDAIWRADQALALELAEFDAWLTGYLDTWPENTSSGPPLPECYKHGRAGRVIGWQFSSGKLSKRAGGGLSRPVPEIEEWRPGKRLDHNLALDLGRWLVDGSQAPVQPSIPATPVINFDEAWGYNERRHVEASRFVALVERMGVDGWQSREELVGGVARWQAAQGLAADGKLGPGTLSALDAE